MDVYEGQLAYYVFALIQESLILFVIFSKVFLIQEKQLKLMGYDFVIM